MVATDEERKIEVLPGVREWTEGASVEIWLNRGGRYVVRAYNECGNNCTDIDLLDLLDWSHKKNVGALR